MSPLGAAPVAGTGSEAEATCTPVGVPERIAGGDGELFVSEAPVLATGWRASVLGGLELFRPFLSG